MDKKDIYEHLAKIYLDASSQKKKKSKKKQAVSRGLFFTSIFVAFFIVAVSLSTFFLRPAKPFRSEIALLIANEAMKINFSFNPAKKETLSLHLNKLNLANYKALGFSVKKADFNDTLVLRVEFINTYNEKSEIYCKNISHKWKDYRLDLSQFKGIADWSEMSGLTFTVEEWNTRDKKGIVYIDNIRLIKS